MNSQETTRETVFFIRFEILKIIRQGRAYTGLAILIFFLFLCALGAEMRLYRLEREKKKLVNRSVQEVITTVSFSVHCLPPAMDVVFPILIGIFCAAIFAGEFENKQVRTMSMRPISRTSLYLGKVVAMSLYAMFFFLLLWLLSFLIGLALFPLSGDVFIWGEPFQGTVDVKKGFILKEAVAWQHYVLAYSLAPLSIISLVSLFMVCSVIFKKFTSAASVPVGLYFVSLALEKMPVFRPIRNYLPTYYVAFWKYSAYPEIPWEHMIHNAIIMVLFAVIALFAGIFIFKSSDI